MSDAWSRARRILAVRLDAMGDLLMTEPALRALADGDRHVTLLASPAGAALAPLLPGVHDTIEYSAPWMKATAPGHDPKIERTMVERLRAGRYDAAVIFTVDTQSPLPAALLCHLAGIPLRAAHCRENPYELLTDWVPEPEPGLSRHEVERQLALVSGLGFSIDAPAMQIRIADRARVRARRRLALAGIDRARPWIALHPGASAASRRYPIDRYADALRALADEGWQAVVLGGPDDGDAASVLHAGVGRRSVHLVTDRLELEEVAAVIAEATVFIGNNSGPAHVAAAVGTPSVILYALTNTQHTPWLVASRVLWHDVPCRNCLRSVCPMGHHLCLRGVPPDRIVASVRELAGDLHAVVAAEAV